MDPAPAHPHIWDRLSEMLSLRMLGALDLTAGDGRSLQSVLSQPRRAALLVYLAAARPSGPQRRDRLLPLFWPEHDDASARHDLSQALYRLRQSLGPDAIETTGKSVLCLNDDVIECDVRAFDQARASRRWAEALDLYRGEFLCGFHVAGAPGFERWMDSERERLREAAADAAWALAAEQIRVAVTEAERTAQRAVDLGPTDEDRVVSFVEALAAAGDRAAAIHFYERWATALETELEISPAPEAEATVQRLRTSSWPAPGRAEPDRAAKPGSAGAGGEDRRPPPPSPIPSGTDSAISERPKRRRGIGSWPGSWPVWRVGGVVALLAAIPALVLLARAFQGSGAPVPRPSNVLEVAGALGAERAPVWSPDGEALAYESDQGGDWDIWVTRLGTGQAINRTASYSGDDVHPTWSPDGRWIAFFSWREGGGYFIMPAMGGTARRVVPWPAGEVRPTPAAWSPDGTAMAYVLGQRREPWIVIRTLADGAARQLRLPTRPRNNTVVGLSWSPDGRFLAYRRALSAVAATAELWLTSVAEGESRQLTDGTRRDGSPSWGPDARELYFVSDRGGSSDLWRLTVSESGRPDGPPRQVTAGMELIDAEVARDGRKLAFTRGRLVRNVYRAPLLRDRPATWADVTQLTFDEADFESIDVHDGSLLLSSDRSGNWDVFVMSASGGALRPTTTDSALDAGPRWSPDGEEVVFYSTRSGHRQVWIMEAGGGPPRQLTRGATDSYYPTWAPNGLEVVASSRRGLVAVTVTDGAERRLTDGPGSHPDWSPDGRWVVYGSLRDGRNENWLVPVAGGEQERLTGREGSVPRWSPDGERIYFLGLAASMDTVWATSVSSREEWPVTALAGRPGHMGSVGLAVDEEYVYFTWQEPRGDIWVADLVPARQ